MSPRVREIIKETLMMQPAFEWIDTESVTAFWTVMAVLWGISNAGLFYAFYFVTIEILKLFPKNLMEAIFSGATLDAWPTATA